MELGLRGSVKYKRQGVVAWYGILCQGVRRGAVVDDCVSHRSSIRAVWYFKVTQVARKLRWLDFYRQVLKPFGGIELAA